MTAEVEHFPEPCAVGGHGAVWCAECMERWPCPSASEAAEWDRDEVAHAAAAYQAGLDAGLNAGYAMGQVMRNARADDPDPWRCAECGSRREIHIVGERDGSVAHAWEPRVLPPGEGRA